MIRVLALIPTLVCCTRLEQYRCETDAQCSQGEVAGACEDTGFCSADDSECPSGRRYVEEAGDDLAGTCVSDPALYLSPDGDDAAEGTRDAPWRTFSRALGALRLGDTLILLDGTYGIEAGTGFADIDCRDGAIACNGAPCRHGTADQPITVRALHERQAFVNNGFGGVIAIKGCRGWTVEGLRAEQGDVNDLISWAPVALEGTSDIVLRRMLVAKPTRFHDASAMDIRGSTRTLVEECEVLDFHGYGIRVAESSDVVIRRSYLNPRGHADIEGSNLDSECPTTGDTAVGSIYTSTVLVENTISEGACRGFQLDTGWGVNGDSGVGDDGLFAGNIAMDAGVAGFSVRTSCTMTEPCNSPDRWAEGNRFVDDVAIDSRDGFVLRGGRDNVVERCTAFNSDNAGVWFDELPETLEASFPSSAYAFNTLVAGAENGFVVQDQAEWSIHYSVADVSGVAYSPDDANVRNRQDLDPQLGDCKVTLPATSPLRGAGRDGVNIGATIENRYENGVLTDTPLWLEGGAFPCGAIVPGVNDEPGASCSDVHERLNVGPDGCPQR